VTKPLFRVGQGRNQQGCGRHQRCYPSDISPEKRKVDNGEVNGRETKKRKPSFFHTTWINRREAGGGDPRHFRRSQWVLDVTDDKEVWELWESKTKLACGEPFIFFSLDFFFWNWIYGCGRARVLTRRTSWSDRRATWVSRAASRCTPRRDRERETATATGPVPDVEAAAQVQQPLRQLGEINISLKYIPHSSSSRHFSFFFKRTWNYFFVTLPKVSGASLSSPFRSDILLWPGWEETSLFCHSSHGSNSLS
jgi:hypothetical protein